ncbi:MAG: pyridoxamine 5'-phosphate oxidase family protein [Alistipes sp.]|nr:pyridoxamine 5'-phosphate oxidase family protein [Alistipes sp.]
MKSLERRAEVLLGRCRTVVLTRCVEVVPDAGRNTAYWQEGLAEHFAEGPADPDYVLLRFRSDRATFWIDGEFAYRAIREEETNEKLG